MMPNGFFQHPMGSFMQPPMQPGMMGNPYYLQEQQFPPQPLQQQYIVPLPVNRAILHGTSMSSSGGRSSDKPILRKPLDGYALLEKVQIVPLGDRMQLPDQTFLNGATTPGSFRLKVYGRNSSSRWIKLGEIDYEETGAKDIVITSNEAVKEIEFSGEFMSLSFIVYGVEKQRSTAPEGARASSPAQKDRRQHASDHGKSDTSSHYASSGTARDDKSRTRRQSGEKRKLDSDDEVERQCEADLKKRRKDEREQRLIAALRQLQRSTELRIKNNVNTNKFVPLACLFSSQLFKYMAKLSSTKSPTYTLNDILDDIRNCVRKSLSKTRFPEESVGKAAARLIIRLNYATSARDERYLQEITQFSYFLLRYTSMPRVDVYGTGSISMYNDLFRIAIYRVAAILADDSAGCRLILSLKIVKWLTLAVVDGACVMAVKQAAFETLLQMLMHPAIMQQFLSDGFFNRIVNYLTSGNAYSIVDGVQMEADRKDAVVPNSMSADLDKELLMPFFKQLVQMSQLFILCQELSDYADMFDSTCNYAVQRNDVSIAARMLDAMSSKVQQLSNLASLDTDECEKAGAVSGDVGGITVDLSTARCLSNYGMLNSVAIVMRQMHAFLAETANPVGKIMKAVADATGGGGGSGGGATKSYSSSSGAGNANSNSTMDFDMGSGGAGSVSVIYHDVLAESMRLFVHSVLIFTHQTACKQHHVETLLLAFFNSKTNNINTSATATVVNSNSYNCCTEVIACATQLIADRRLFMPAAVVAGGGGADSVLHTDDLVVDAQSQSASISATVPKALVETIRYALNIFTLFDQLAQRLFSLPLPIGSGGDEHQQRDKADIDNENVVALEIATDLLRLSYDLRYHACLLHTLAHPLIMGMFARYFGQAQYSSTTVVPLPQPSNNKMPNPTKAATAPTTSGSTDKFVERRKSNTASKPQQSKGDAVPPKPLYKLSDSWQQNPTTILLSELLHCTLKYINSYSVNVRYAQLLPSVEQVTQVGALKELTKMLMPYRDFIDNVARTYHHGSQQQAERPQQTIRNTCTRMLGVLERASQLDMIKMPRYSTAICVRLISDCVYAFQAVPSGVSGNLLPFSKQYATLNASTTQLDAVRIVIQCNAVEALCAAVRANCRYALDKTTSMSYERFESLTAIVAACLQVLKCVVMVVCRMTVNAGDVAAGDDASKSTAIPFGYINDIAEAVLHAYVLCFYNDDENDMMRVTISRDCTTIFAALALLASYDSNSLPVDSASSEDKADYNQMPSRHGFVALMQCVAERTDSGERDQLPVMQFMRNFFQLLYEAPKRLFAEFSTLFGASSRSNGGLLVAEADDGEQLKLQRIQQFQHRVRDAISEHGNEIVQVFFGNVCSRIVYAAYSPKLPIAQGIQFDDSTAARKYKTACILMCTVMLHGSPQLASALFTRLLHELVEAVDIQPRKINVSSAIWSLRQIGMLLCTSRNSSALRVVFEDPLVSEMPKKTAATDTTDIKSQYCIAPGDIQSMQKFHQFLHKLDQFLRAKSLRLLQEQNESATGNEVNRGSSNMTFASLNDVMQYLRVTSNDRAADGEGGRYEAFNAAQEDEIDIEQDQVETEPVVGDDAVINGNTPRTDIAGEETPKASPAVAAPGGMQH